MVTVARRVVCASGQERRELSRVPKLHVIRMLLYFVMNFI